MLRVAPIEIARSVDLEQPYGAAGSRAAGQDRDGKRQALLPHGLVVHAGRAAHGVTGQAGVDEHRRDAEDRLQGTGLPEGEAE